MFFFRFPKMASEKKLEDTRKRLVTTNVVRWKSTTKNSITGFEIKRNPKYRSLSAFKCLLYVIFCPTSFLLCHGWDLFLIWCPNFMSFAERAVGYVYFWSEDVTDSKSKWASQGNVYDIWQSYKSMVKEKKAKKTFAREKIFLTYKSYVEQRGQ